MWWTCDPVIVTCENRRKYRTSWLCRSWYAPSFVAIAVILRHGRENRRTLCNFSIRMVADVGLYKKAVLWRINWTMPLQNSILSKFTAAYCAVLCAIAGLSLCQLWKPQHTYVKRAVCPSAKRTLRWIGYSRSSYGVSRNPEGIVVIMDNNVDIISETYKASGKLQIVDFKFLTIPLQFDDSNLRNAFEYLEMICITILSPCFWMKHGLIDWLIETIVWPEHVSGAWAPAADLPLPLTAQAYFRDTRSPLRSRSAASRSKKLTRSPDFPPLCSAHIVLMVVTDWRQWRTVPGYPLLPLVR